MAGKQMSAKERFWRDMVGRRRSGQTIRVFCEEHGLSEPSFYAWRRLIAERDAEASAPAFVPVHVASPVEQSSLEVVVSSGRVVRVAPGFDAATLRRLLVVLEEAPSC
jgi:hypothetical protein